MAACLHDSPTPFNVAPPCNIFKCFRKHSSSLGQLEQIGQPQNGTPASAVRKSVDLIQLMENDGTEVFYCNTISANSQPQGQGKEQLEVPEEDNLYINVKH